MSQQTSKDLGFKAFSMLLHLNSYKFF
uniref:Uncharacterized protein n=1 Tax=Rhizophora mucronata TaxID=61149 RepID=A0A2P2PLU8_RHIMU